LIHLHGVTKQVPTAEGSLTILHTLDLHLPAGRLSAVVGPSGSGKSTLLGLIAGLDAPSTGRIEVDGVDITRLGEDELAALRGARLGFVFQFFHLIPSLTALENVAVPMEIAGRRGAEGRARELLAEMGLGARVGHYPTQLSGGEQQRVALARALANEPRLLLADEPTGNLDTDSAATVVELLFAAVARRGTTVLLVTHDADLAARADLIVRLRGGRIESRIERAPAPAASAASV
jgi:putative ABC transport system ATP-binding protein